MCVFICIEREREREREMEENQVDEAPKERRRLKLKPRSKDAGTVGGYANSSSRSNPFGAAKPREANLEKKGVDWKKRDADLSKRLVKLPSMSKKKEEEYAALEGELAFAKKELDEAEGEEEKQKAQEEYEKKIKEKEEFIKVLMSERRERRRGSDDRRQNNGGGFSSGYNNNNRRGGRSNGRYNRASTGSFDRDEKDDLKIFVGSLSWGVDDMMLGRTFEKEGFEVVSARVVMDRDDPTRSRGFGYVRFADVKDVRKALETMEGFMLDGRPIRVDMATTRRRGGGGGGGNRMRGTSTGSFSRDGGYERY